MNDKIRIVLTWLAWFAGTFALLFFVDFLFRGEYDWRQYLAVSLIVAFGNYYSGVLQQRRAAKKAGEKKTEK